MPVPAYFATSPVTGGSALPISVPPIGGVIYDFVGLNGVRLSASIAANSLPVFNTVANSFQLLNSTTISPRALSALGGGISELGVRITISDGDTAPGNTWVNTSFLSFNTVAQVVDLSQTQTYSHDGFGDVGASAIQTGYPDNKLATGWSLITDPAKLAAIYASLVSTGGVLDLKWQQDGTGGNALNFTSGIDASLLSFPTVSANVYPSVDLIAASDTGLSNTDNITADNTPTLNGTSAPNDLLQIFDGATLLGTTTADVNGDWSFTPSASLSANVYNITVKAVDGSNNVLASSSVLAITVVVPPAAPGSLDLTTPSDNGTSNTDNLTSDTTPTIAGTAPANSTVQIFDAGTPIGTATADGSGNWTFTPTIPLPPGVHPITATATDAFGNVSPASASLPITIVATPAVPSNLDLVTPSDTGVLNTDDRTKDNTPTIVGKADPNVEVSLFDGAVLLGTATTNPSGDWMFTPISPLGEGAHPITVKAKDAAGGLGAASGPLTVTIDTLAPAAPASLDLTAASDDGTSNTDNITGDTTPTITGNAEPNSTVALFDGTTPLGTATANGSGVWTFTPSSPLFVGTYSVTATATDAAGNMGAASAPLPLTITAAPGVPYNLDLVDASDTGDSITDEITQDTTPTVTGKADPATTVVVFDGTTPLGEAIADASGNWTFTPLSPLADGLHPFSVKQKDGAGNLGTATAPLNITIDTTAPAVPAVPNLIDSSDTGTSSTDNITSDNTPTFDGVAPLNAAMVELFAGTTSLGKAPVNGSGNWSFTPTTALADNIYSITVKAIDAAGNISLASSPLSVTIDALPPQVTFTPLETNDPTPALIGSIDDPNAAVEVKINGVTYPATNKGDGTWFIPDNTIAPLTDGGFDILVTATDNQGNSSTDNGSGGSGGAGGGAGGGTTKAVIIDRTAPTGTILPITSTAAGVNTVPIQFTEPVTNFDVSDLQLTRNVGGVDTPVSLTGANLTSADGGKTWALTNLAGITNLTGDYKLTLNRSDITDLAGNGVAADATSAFSLGDDCVFGTPLVAIKLKGKKGTKKNGSNSGNSLGGGNGKDSLKGLNGNDYLAGGGGGDRLNGGKGKDRLVGGTGRDRLIGKQGKDKSKGGGGKDMLTGGGGKDILVGNNGSDILTGGAQKDILKGGKGKDMFVFSGLAFEGNDLIKRFQTAQDVIDLRPVFARAEFTGATPDAKFHQYIQTVQVGANTQVRVDLDGAGSGTVFGAIATLQNINASAVSCSNFVVA